jgi:cytochrome b561
MSEVKRYNTTMVILHWLLAFLVLGTIFVGGVMLDEMDSQHPQKILLLKLHVLVGVCILLFTLLRLVVRVVTPQPAPPANGNKWLNKASTGVHHLLYLLTIFSVLSGITLAISADLPAVLLSQAGGLPEEYGEFMAHEAHEIFAQLLLLSIALHATAALYHQFILKDGLISRMSLRGDK